MRAVQLPPAGGLRSGTGVRAWRDHRAGPPGRRAARTTLTTLPSTVTVHYPHHSLQGRALDVIAGGGLKQLSVTIRHPDGGALKVPRWMLEPAAAQINRREQVALNQALLPAVAALLEAHATALASNLKPRDAEANPPRSRGRRAHPAADGTRAPAGTDRPDGRSHHRRVAERTAGGS